ncbi:MAG: dockerin type I repeat-containing protein [Planctomycetota bacterium]
MIQHSPNRQLLQVAVLIGVFSLVPTATFGFIRGDANSDGSVSIADPIALLNVLFVPGTPPLACADAGDGNDDGALNIADAVYVLNALFVPGSSPIPAPYPTSGTDPTPDSLPSCAPTSIPFQTISIGDDSGHATGIQTVIYTANAWSSFWSLHSNAPLPSVDFNQEMVVVVLAIAPSLGHTIDITQIVENAGDLEIHYTALLPGAYLPMPIEPHHVVRAPRTFGNNVVFVPTIIALP